LRGALWGRDSEILDDLKLDVREAIEPVVIGEKGVAPGGQGGAKVAGVGSAEPMRSSDFGGAVHCRGRELYRLDHVFLEIPVEVGEKGLVLIADGLAPTLQSREVADDGLYTGLRYSCLDNAAPRCDR